MTAESSSAKYIVSRGICGKHCDKFCLFTLAELFKLGGVAELLLEGGKGGGTNHTSR